MSLMVADAQHRAWPMVRCGVRSVLDAGVGLVVAGLLFGLR